MENERTPQQKVFINLFNTLMEVNPFEYGQLFYHHGDAALDVYAWCMNNEDKPDVFQINHVLAALTFRLIGVAQEVK